MFMESNLRKRTACCRIVAKAVAFALLGSCAATWAAGGTVTTASVVPNTVFVNDTVTLKVSVADGSSGVACNMSWAVVDANNFQLKGAVHPMQSDANNVDYSVPFGIASPGVYTVQATGGAAPNQLPVCQGTVKTTLTVKAKAQALGVVAPVNPGLKRKP
jgi:hypothetical protein